MATVPEMKCKNCGAPIQYVSGENVLHCSYCGSTTMVASPDNIVKLEEHYIIPSTQSSERIQQYCREWMGKGFFKAGDLAQAAKFDQINGIYLPFWIVYAQVTTYWSGMNHRTRTVGSGSHRRTETYWEPASGNISEKVGWVVYARSNMDEYYGLAALNPGGIATKADWGGFPLSLGLGDKKSEGIDLATGKQPFQAELAKGLKIINGQITQDQADERSKAQIKEFHRKKVEKQVDRVTDCDTNILIERTDLVYAPLWFIDYNYKGKGYQMLVEGYKGRVITGEAPVGKWDKVVVSAVVGGLIALGCGLCAYFIKAPWASYLYLGSALAIVGVSIHAILTALKKE